MASSSIAFGSITATYAEIYATAGKALIETYFEYTNTCDKPLSLDLVIEESVQGIINLRETVVIAPRTKGLFSRKLKYIQVRATDGLPTVGVLAFSGADNSSTSFAKIATQRPIFGTDLQVPYPTYGSLPSIADDGAEELVNKLIGTGFFRVRYMAATSRWGVCAGECIAFSVDPHSVVTAGATTPVDLAWFTIPAGMIGDGEEWELSTPSEAAANTGNDSVIQIIATVIFQTGPNNPSQYSSMILRVNRTASILARAFSIFGSSIQRSTLNFANAIPIVLRITPATIGNTTYIRRAQIRRLS
jgi:hypothetical protein